MTLLLTALLALPAFAERHILGPYSAATNHADDIQGVPDTRPNTWGTAGYSIHTVQFHPPEGYRTRILRIYGDFQGWIRKNPSGKCVGVLWGLQSSAAEGSSRVSPAADNTFVYVQDSVCGSARRNFRAPVDYYTQAGGLLDSDNVLISKVSAWLNETGKPVHLEPSFTIVYQFEKEMQ